MGMLDIGAGAAGGLETLLARLHAEDLFNEQKRKNLADEALHGRQIDDNAAMRRQMETNRQADKAEQAHKDEVAHTMGILRIRPIGTTVDPSVMQHELATGATPDFYEQGTEMQGDDGSEPLPVIKFRGTSDQITAARTAEDRARALDARQSSLEAQTAARDAAAAARDEGLRLRAQGLDLAERRFRELQNSNTTKQNTIKIGEGGKRALRSIEQAEPLIDKVLAAFPQDIEDPNAQPDKVFGLRLNQKYNTPRNVLGNIGEYAKYKVGIQDPNSSMIQIEKLLQPKGEGGNVILTDKDRETIERFRAQMLETRRELRDVKLALNQDIDRLGATLKFANIAAVPLLIGLGAIGLAIVRRRSDRAARGEVKKP